MGEKEGRGIKGTPIPQDNVFVKEKQQGRIRLTDRGDSTRKLQRVRLRIRLFFVITVVEKNFERSDDLYGAKRIIFNPEIVVDNAKLWQSERVKIYHLVYKCC